jgi:predicted DNA-binding transcriptional regulator AlpA
MARLIKPSEYAKECGISRQAVYAKIKKGLLKAKKVDGQIFIELDSSVDIQPNKKNTKNYESSANKDLIAAKDETIKILKETINDLKATNNLIVGTLKSEVDLLKEAFAEMQQLYRTQIEHLKINTPIQLEHKSDPMKENDFIEIKELAKSLGLDKSKRKKFKKAAIAMQKNGDFRFVIVENDVFALKTADYSDFLEALKEEEN